MFFLVPVWGRSGRSFTCFWAALCPPVQCFSGWWHMVVVDNIYLWGGILQDQALPRASTMPTFLSGGPSGLMSIKVPSRERWFLYVYASVWLPLGTLKSRGVLQCVILRPSIACAIHRLCHPLFVLCSALLRTRAHKSQKLF